MNPCRTIAIANQKGGVGKTTTALNLGTGLVRQGKKVLLVDADSQANLTQILGWKEPDKLINTLSLLMKAEILKEQRNIHACILQHDEGVDLLPSNIDMSVMEANLFSMPLGRERILGKVIEPLQREYDYIIIDCSPNLSMMTINALVCANSVIVPVQTHYLPTRGLQQLLQTVGDIRDSANRHLQVEGILFTMYEQNNISKSVVDVVNEAYSGKMKIFDTKIPKSVKAIEAGVVGQSIYEYKSDNPVSLAYERLVKEVIDNERQAKKRNDVDRNER